MDIELLITDIEKRPILWDVSNELHKDRNKKNNEWISVANVVVENFQSKNQSKQKVIGKLLNILFFNLNK